MCAGLWFLVGFALTGSGGRAEAMIEATHGCRLSCNRLILVTSLNGGLPFWLPHPRENHGVVEEEAWVLVDAHTDTRTLTRTRL